MRGVIVHDRGAASLRGSNETRVVVVRVTYQLRKRPTTRWQIEGTFAPTRIPVHTHTHTHTHIRAPAHFVLEHTQAIILATTHTHTPELVVALVVVAPPDVDAVELGSDVPKTSDASRLSPEVEEVAAPPNTEGVAVVAAVREIKMFQ